MNLLMVAIRTGTLAIAAALGLGTASAGEPVAIVVELTAEGTGLQFMEYVDEGHVIDLGADGTITLGYLV